MVVFRWVMAVIGGFFAIAYVVTLAIYVLNGDDRFGDLSTRLRRWATIVILLWFNLEVWGRVVWTLIHWTS